MMLQLLHWLELPVGQCQKTLPSSNNCLLDHEQRWTAHGKGESSSACEDRLWRRMMVVVELRSHEDSLPEALALGLVQLML